MLRGVIVASGAVAQSVATVGLGPPELLRLVNRPLIAFAAEALRSLGLQRAVVVASGPDHADLVRAAAAPPPWSASLVDVPRGAGPWRIPMLAQDDQLTVAIEGGAVPGGALAAAVRQMGDTGLGALFVTAPDGDVVAGVLRPAAVQLLATNPWAPDRPVLADARRSLEGAGVPLRVTPSPGAWRWSGHAGKLLDTHRRLLDELADDPRGGPTLSGESVRGAVFAHPSADIDDSVLRGPIVVGPRACLHGAYVGPYTAISDDVVIEGAEVEHSIVLPGASIRYPGSRIEGSVVGPGAKVFRSFALPEALRLTVGPAAEVGLA